MAIHFNTTVHTTPTSNLPAPVMADLPEEVLNLQQLIDRASEDMSSPKNNKREDRDENAPIQGTQRIAKKALFGKNDDVEFKTPLPRTNSPGNGKKALVSPVFNNWGATEVTGLPPPTPMKKKSVAPVPATVPPVPATKLFQHHQEMLSTGKFQIEMNVTKIDSGSYVSVYEISNFPGVVLKAFHGQNMRFNDERMTKFLVQMGKNYTDVALLGLPVAKVLNVNELVEQKYILQERIPHRIDRSNQLQMLQVQKFLTASVKHNVMMDLQPQNLRVKEDGTVVLIDFVEEKAAVSLFITKACKAWIEPCTTKQEAEQLLTLLTAPFLNKHSDYDKAWFKEIIGSAASPKKHGTEAHGILKL